MKKESKSTKHYWKDVFRDFSPKYGLLGHEISYSLSPSIHRFVMQALGIQEEYLLLDVPPEELDEFFAHPKAQTMHGLNITKPYKWQAAKKFDSLDPINTIFKLTLISFCTIPVSSTEESPRRCKPPRCVVKTKRRALRTH